jgi:2-polyprenyl-3-methyl-5-hydroxy-6-metoxy-1,4-benzoquinol methylase
MAQSRELTALNPQCIIFNSLGMHDVQSPLVPGSEVRLVREIPVNFIIRDYQRKYGINTRPYFMGIPAVRVYECQASGYRFYYPFTLAGNGEFYAQLENTENYYVPWKWEHQLTYDLVSAGDTVLEVGAGRGDFLRKLQAEKEVNCLGLELNQSAIAHAQKNGVRLLPEFVQDHARTHRDQYPVVCTFQVLEHIADVRSFIQGMVDCLAPGGKLIIAVPNNDSFIQYDKHVLNMPPHHMGLWNERSLKKLGELFRLQLLRVEFEPLQPFHYEWYQTVMARKNFGELAAKAWYVALRAGMGTLTRETMRKKAPGIRGHSVAVVYEKRRTQ